MSRDRDHAGPTGRGATPSSPPSLDEYFDSRSLHTLRSAVAAHAAAAGLGRQRVYDVTAAAHELAANTVRHGPGHGRLLLWMDEAFLYCQVSDDGTDARANGQLAADPAPWQANHGHGLWLIGQIADELTIDRGPAGVTALVAFAITPGPATPFPSAPVAGS